MFTLNQVKNNPQVLEFLRQTEIRMRVLKYSEHGLRHANLVSERAREIAKAIGLTEREQEMCAIAGFCHDMGNFLGRTQHHYWGALLFHQVFQNQNPEEVSVIAQAIATHDKQSEMKIANSVSAVVVLADKSDVHRSRVRKSSMAEIQADIHSRVNQGATFSRINIDKKKKRITLILKIDKKVVPIMEYFEIFTDRMVYCRQAAEFLGYRFGLVINHIELL
jgi:metal-dependent HD superfamily phosphatase/phosphodiesterase